jgi:hypothetical protein
MPAARPFRIISRILCVGPPPFSSFAAGFTDATSNWGFAGGVCACKFAQIKAIAVRATYRIVNLLALLCETALMVTSPESWEYCPIETIVVDHINKVL